MAKRIEQLTVEEEALLPILRDGWLKIGLATGPADREAAQAAISDAYFIAGLRPPKLWIWLGSPWAGCIGAWMLSEVAGRVRAQLWDHARDRVREKVGAKVWDLLRDEVGAEMWDRGWNQVWDQMRGAARGKVGQQIWHRLREEVRDEVQDRVREQVEDRVLEQIRGEVWDQLEAKVWNQVWAPVWDQVGEQLGAQLPVDVAAEAWGELEQAWSPIGEQTAYAGYGLHDTNWLAFYDFFRRIKRVKGPDRLEPLMRLAGVAGWWWPFEGVCIITERPAALHCDEAGRLHCDSAPALLYPDGWAIHAWRGIRIPSWLIEEKQRIMPDRIEAETNAEWRRVMLEIFGFDRYIEARGARLVAEDECHGLPRQLFEIDLRGEPIRVLRVVNDTVEPDGRRRQFHLGVPLTCNTPHEAVAWCWRDLTRSALGELGLAGHAHWSAMDPACTERSFLPANTA